jgi:hypothetical protein
MTDAELMQELERVARKRHKGHFTIMRFPANWRVMFGTPEGRDDMVTQQATGPTFAIAAGAALAKEKIAHHRATQDRLRPQRQAGIERRRRTREAVA